MSCIGSNIDRKQSVIIFLGNLALTLLLSSAKIKEVAVLLKKTLSILLISRWLIALFVISVTGVAVSPYPKEIPNTRILEGTIIDKNIDMVTVGSHEHPGQILTLSAGPQAQRLALQTGDQNIVEYSPDYIIQTISKQG